MTLNKTGSESQTFCCNFKNLHLCCLNQRLKFPKRPNNQNTVKKIELSPVESWFLIHQDVYLDLYVCS